jgi:hypothetical protein
MGFILYHHKSWIAETTDTDSKGPKIEVAKKLQISTDRRVYSQTNANPVFSSDKSQGGANL